MTGLRTCPPCTCPVAVLLPLFNGSSLLSYYNYIRKKIYQNNWHTHTSICISIQSSLWASFPSPFRPLPVQPLLSRCRMVVLSSVSDFEINTFNKELGLGLGSYIFFAFDVN